MCYTDAEVDRFLAIPYGRLTPEDLRPIYWDAYVCWGTWPQIAYYVPRLLELYLEGRSLDEEQLYARLLLAVRPELASPRSLILSEEMADDEQQSLFEFFQAVMEARLEERTPEDKSGIMTEMLAFLGAFHEPIVPLLARLKASKRRQVRGNLCLFLSDHFWEPASWENLWMENYSLLPENQAALDSFLAPQSVAEYLLAHIEDVKDFPQERRQYVELAFDYAMQQAQTPPA